MPDTVVFIPALNEEDNLPAVLAELRAGPARRGRRGDRRRLDRRHGAGRPRGGAGGGLVRREPRPAGRDRGGLRLRGRARLRLLRARRRRRAASRGRAGAAARDGARRARATSRSARASRRAKATARAATCRARPAGSAPGCCARHEIATGPAVQDARAGCAPSTRRRCRSWREPYTSGAPEVQAMLRLDHAGLRVEEVPVHMRRARQRRVEAAGQEAREGGGDGRGHADRLRARAPPRGAPCGSSPCSATPAAGAETCTPCARRACGGPSEVATADDVVLLSGGPATAARGPRPS